MNCTVVYTEAERAFESATGWFTFVKYIEATLQIYSLVFWKKYKNTN